MPEKSRSEEGKTHLTGSAYILENISFHAGDCELYSTLQWISDEKEFLDDAISERIKAALRLPVYKEKEVLQIFKDYRDLFPKEDWWWYPEKL